MRRGRKARDLQKGVTGLQRTATGATVRAGMGVLHLTPTCLGLANERRYARLCGGGARGSADAYGAIRRSRHPNCRRARRRRRGAHRPPVPMRTGDAARDNDAALRRRMDRDVDPCTSACPAGCAGVPGQPYQAVAIRSRRPVPPGGARAGRATNGSLLLHFAGRSRASLGARNVGVRSQPARHRISPRPRDARRSGCPEPARARQPCGGG